MSAAVVAHAVGSYPYPQAILSQVSRQPLISAGPPGRPCRHATHMRSADGQSAVFSLDGPLRSRVPLEAGFPPVRLRLRPLHATTAAAWTARRDDQLAAYFSEAAARYRVHPGAGRWADWADTISDAPVSVFLDDPAFPRRRPLTVGVGTGNRKNCSSVGGIIVSVGSDAQTVDAAVATESRDRFRRREAEEGGDRSLEEERQTRLEVQRHRERMRESTQVADLLAPAGAAGGDVRSRFWSESARATAGSGGFSGVSVRRCSTAPAETSFRRVSGNRVLSQLRDQCAHMPVIF